MAAAVVFLGRFLQGQWRGMRVIETPPDTLAPGDGVASARQSSKQVAVLPPG
jgi:hypothetical protein